MGFFVSFVLFNFFLVLFFVGLFGSFLLCKASLYRNDDFFFFFLLNTFPEGFPPGYNSTSAQGNYLEAINLSFNGKL